tara:strand:- start:1617 stop:1853 length:237 start_codon:yes stop_codon:yes gene_type:complete
VESNKNKFQIGDIVTEVEIIIPHERGRWNGLVVKVEKGKFLFHTLNELEPQDRIVVLWLKSGKIEELPCSVLSLVYRQ